MDIGEIIKQRRLEIGMSQEELAKKVGYKSRSSINKIELDGRGLPQSKIKAIADALDTTPSFLMGWENEPHKVLPNDSIFLLSDFEKQIIIEYRKADDIAQAMVLRALSIDEKVAVKGDGEKMA